MNPWAKEAQALAKITYIRDTSITLLGVLHHSYSNAQSRPLLIQSRVRISEKAGVQGSQLMQI
jgi:hypothetical protein